ncbi:unnamed protein product [Calicophoron daubneyi]|uniref:BZIP domain-containing protein n=1 Tax=Calicophoron daubneyi TaxID=300641 RepID=A0AAV2U2N2_CALDB
MGVALDVFADYMACIYCLATAISCSVETVIYFLLPPTPHPTLLSKSPKSRKNSDLLVRYGHHTATDVQVRVNLHVCVLLHELYPAKEASSTVPADRSERLSHQDFIMALQKIDLEGALGSAIEEADFIFQSNQLPLSCFTSETASRYKPASSSTCGAVSDAETPTVNRMSDSSPLPCVFSPLLSDTTWSDPLRNSKSDIEEAAVSDGLPVSERAHVGVSEPNTSSDPVIHNPVVPKPEAQASSPRVSGEDYSHLRSMLRKAPKMENPENADIKLPIESTTQPFSEQAETRSSAVAVVHASCDELPPKSENFDAHASLDALRLPHELSYAPDTDLPSEIGEVEVATEAYQLTDRLQQPRSSRRKSVIRPIIHDGRPSRSASLSSGSELENCSFVREGYSSDSELDYRPENIQMRTEDPLHPRRSRTCDSYSAALFGYSSETSLSGSEVLSKSGKSSYHSGSARTWDAGSLSSVATGRRGDRHLRDMDALEIAAVPFTYEEIVHCSNERFREMKSSPDLTSQQVTAMLDARRRATNRQAAERCRRMKTAVRDELSERLSELRLERQQLTKRVEKARQRRQEARDLLIAEEKRMLSMLRGPNGNQLRFADWRVRLTNEGELVVVAVGR